MANRPNKPPSATQYSALLSFLVNDYSWNQRTRVFPSRNVFLEFEFHRKIVKFEQNPVVLNTPQGKRTITVVESIKKVPVPGSGRRVAIHITLTPEFWAILERTRKNTPMLGRAEVTGMMRVQKELKIGTVVKVTRPDMSVQYYFPSEGRVYALHQDHSVTPGELERMVRETQGAFNVK